MKTVTIELVTRRVVEVQMTDEEINDIHNGDIHNAMKMASAAGLRLCHPSGEEMGFYCNDDELRVVDL